MLAPAAAGGGGGGEGGAAALRWFEAYDAHGGLDVRVAHPAHCRVRVARLAEGGAPAASAAGAGAGAGAAGAGAAGAGAGAGSGEGMVLHNVRI